jgi:hypothetical protein
MPCYRPLKAYRLAGETKLSFAPKPYDFIVERLSLPCGRCIGCRLERSRQWAVRCVHEASLYDNNCFITLTYSPEYLPADGSLDVRHFQRFMKRLRKKYGKNIRFYHCGEYGEKYRRPHYHACLFNFDFSDKKFWKITKSGDRLYTSKSLEQLWPFGFCTIGDVTFDSAAYVARYIMKKVNGHEAENHYTEIDMETGEVIHLKPEYTTMSRRPGVGKLWLDKYKSDVYPHDYLIMNGKKMKPPKYYDYVHEMELPIEMQQIKEKRKKLAENNVDNTPERLRIREQVKLAQIKKLVRNVDKET